MLFRCHAGHGLEPVGEMGGPLFQRPLFHGFRNLIGYLQIQLLPVFHTGFPCLEGGSGKPFLHCLFIKYHATEQFR